MAIIIEHVVTRIRENVYTCGILGRSPKYRHSDDCRFVSGHVRMFNDTFGNIFPRAFQCLHTTLLILTKLIMFFDVHEHVRVSNMFAVAYNLNSYYFNEIYFENIIY